MKRTTLLLLFVATTGLFTLRLQAQEGADHKSAATAPHADGRVFFLENRGGKINAVNPDGTGLTVILSGLKNAPDGIDIDESTGLVYWSNMGRPADNDGSVERVTIDGKNQTLLVPVAQTFTPKQLKLDRKNHKMYWSDREGMRVMRANMDGSNVETLVETARGDAARKDAANWCVGLALDVEGGKFYWTQKGPDNGMVGSIRRANLAMPKGQTAANRTDIEILFAGLPEPVDLELDLGRRMMYWTDRGDPPSGNNVSRGPMQMPKNATATTRTDREIVLPGLDEGVGLALDVKHNRLFAADTRGHLYSANLDGSNKKTLGTNLGNLTGITYTSR